MGEKGQELDTWLAAQGEKEEVPVDSLIEPIDIPSKQ